MIYTPSDPREYKRKRKGKIQKGRWEIDLSGVLDNGLQVRRVRRVFPSSPGAGPCGKRQAAAMGRELFELWNRHGRVLRPGEKPTLQETGAMRARSGTAPTFSQFKNDYLEFCASPSAGPKGANRPSTLCGKRVSLDLHLLPVFGMVRMDTLVRRQVDRYVIQKAKAGRSESSIYYDLNVLRHMLRVAFEYELIETLPRFRVPSKTQTDVEALNPDEITRFMATCEATYELRRATLLEFYLRTGLRSGEALALTPADLDLDVAQPIVRVYRTWNDRGFGPTKGGKARIVPLAKPLVAKLDMLLSERGMSARADDVHPFSAERTPKRPMTRKHVRDLVRNIGELAQTRYVYTHMLRHTFGTECARRSIPPLTIKEWMGHSDLDVTMRYLHLVDPDHLRWANLLDR